MSSTAGKRTKPGDPAVIEILSSDGSEVEEILPPLAKKARSESNKALDAKERARTEGGFFLTKVQPLSPHHNRHSLGIRDLTGLEGPQNAITKTWQFDYMFDPEWLWEQFPHNARDKAQFVYIHGERHKDQLVEFANRFEKGKITIVNPDLPLPYGVHHTKMMIFQYEDDGLRVVVHTANLIPRDWALKTQAIYITPKLKRKPADGKHSKDKSEGFGSDLANYLRKYKRKPVMDLAGLVDEYDFSSVPVRLIGSTPGYHQGYEAMKDQGICKLQRLLAQHQNASGTTTDGRKSQPKTAFSALMQNRSALSSETSTKEETESKTGNRADGTPQKTAPYYIGQFSSIGSLGKNAGTWITSQFLRALKGEKPVIAVKGGQSPPQSSPGDELRFIFPTVEEVRESLEGWAAGGSIPYNSGTRGKQLWLEAQFFHRWRARVSGREHCMPHIKTYARVRPHTAPTSNSSRETQPHEIDWFLVTSANLSQAAWGTYQKQGTQLMVRHYELGVLVHPKAYPTNVTLRNLYSTDYEAQTDMDMVGVPIPYDLPPQRYSTGDEAWTVDTVRHSPDRHSLTWG
eukprot:Clim_evm8s165 gene=Clim_evmTU8s165